MECSKMVELGLELGVGKALLSEKKNLVVDGVAGALVGVSHLLKACRTFCKTSLIVKFGTCQQKSDQNHPFLTRFVLCQFQELSNSQST
jgi:hypothetical protein